MIHIKSEKELERMRVAGRITALARKAAADAVHPGVTTEEIDRIVRKTIEDAGAKLPSFGYGGFRAVRVCPSTMRSSTAFRPRRISSAREISSRWMSAPTSAATTVTAPLPSPAER